MLNRRQKSLSLAVFGAILFAQSSFAQRRISDVDSIDALARANPAGYSLALSGPEEIAAAEPIAIRVAYSQPDREAGAERRWAPRDYWLRGFLLRGAIACGMPKLPCPTPEMIREENSSIAEQQSLLLSQWNGSADLRKFLPALPPGDYVVYAIMQSATIHRLGDPHRSATSQMVGEGTHSYLVSTPYRFRIVARAGEQN